MEASIRTERKLRPFAGALVSLALAVFFSLIIFTCNTPLGPEIGSDNAMYLTMGTALAQGYAPYSDIFDHKGPLLFLLQMLPQVFAGGYSTLAVFVQEVLFLWASLLVLARTAKRLGACPLAVQLVYLALLAPAADGGNLTEEYANLFTLIGLDVMTGVFSGGDGLGDGKKLFAPAAVMGAMAMLCFMTRANNVLPLAGAVCALALSLAAYRRFAGLGQCALGFLAGCAAVFVPVLLWLASHGAVADAVYGAITHNMMYADTGDTGRVHMLLFGEYGHYAMLIALIACLGGAASFLRTRRVPLALAMIAGAGCAGYAGFISHKYYYHYLMLGVPMAALGAAQILALARAKAAGKEKAVCCAVMIVCLCALAVVGANTNEKRIGLYRQTQDMSADAQALYALVPEEDRDSFMGYRVEPKWYVAAGALPCMRFYFLQEILAQADPAVMDEIVEEFRNDPPKWLVIYYNREFGPPYDERVSEIFAQEYAFVAAAGQYQLLQHREAGTNE